MYLLYYVIYFEVLYINMTNQTVQLTYLILIFHLIISFMTSFTCQGGLICGNELNDLRHIQSCLWNESWIIVRHCYSKKYLEVLFEVLLLTGISESCGVPKSLLAVPYSTPAGTDEYWIFTKKKNLRPTVRVPRPGPAAPQSDKIMNQWWTIKI